MTLAAAHNRPQGGSGIGIRVGICPQSAIFSKNRD
jgi:hypothetical protein